MLSLRKPMTRIPTCSLRQSLPAPTHPMGGSLWLGTAIGGKGMPFVVRVDVLEVSAPKECQAVISPKEWIGVCAPK